MDVLDTLNRLNDRKASILRRKHQEICKHRKQLKAIEYDHVRKLNQQRLEMEQEDLLSHQLNQLYLIQTQKQKDQDQENEFILYNDIIKARDIAKTLGISQSTGTIGGQARLEILQNRIQEKKNQLVISTKAHDHFELLQKENSRRKAKIRLLSQHRTKKQIEEMISNLRCDGILDYLKLDKSLYTREEQVSLLNHESLNYFTPVLIAIYQRNLSLLRKLLDHGCNVNFETQTGYTPILAAILTNDEVAVSMLVEYKADLNYETKYGVTPMLLAADKGRAKILRILIEAKTNVDQYNVDHRSPLIQATISNHLDIVKILLGNGANGESRDLCGRSALEWAKLVNADSVIECLEEKDTLLKRIFNGVAQRQKLLEEAMQSHDIPQLKKIMVLESGSPYFPNHEDSEGNTPFLSLCKTGNLDDIIFGLNMKCCPTHCNRFGKNALIEAAYNGNEYILSLLTLAGCHPSMNDFNGCNVYKYLIMCDKHELSCSLKSNENDLAKLSCVSPRLTLGTPHTDYLGVSTSIDTIVNSLKDKFPTARTHDTDNELTCPSPTVSGQSNDDQRLQHWIYLQKKLRTSMPKKSEYDNERLKIFDAFNRGRRSGIIPPILNEDGRRQRIIICMQCKKSRAKKKCVDCDQNYCQKCHARLHEISHRRHHKSEDIVQQGTKNKSQTTPTQNTQFTLERCKDELHSLISQLLVETKSGERLYGNRLNHKSRIFDVEIEKYERKLKIESEKELGQGDLDPKPVVERKAYLNGESFLFSDPAELKLAEFYITQKKYTTAQNMLTHIEEIIRPLLPTFHPTLLRIVVDYATIAHLMHKEEDCCQLLEKAFNNFYGMIADDDISMLSAIRLLIQSLTSQSRFRKALHICRQVYKSRLMSLAPGHSATLEAKELIDILIQESENYEMKSEDIIAKNAFKPITDKKSEVVDHISSQLDAFRILVLENAIGMEKFLKFADQEYLKELVRFWKDIENFKLSSQSSKELRQIALSIYTRYIKSHSVKIITICQQKSIKKAVTSTDQHLERKIFDDVQNTAFEIIFKLFQKYQES